MNREWLEIGDARLEFRRWNSEATNKLPILLLHEGLGSVALWKDFPQRLSAATGREVIAWSRQRHGWSSPVVKPHAIDYMHTEAFKLPRLHQALNIQKAHWLGHSDGGSIALIGAATSSHLVESLTLEAPHVFVEDQTVESIARIAEVFSQSDMPERMLRYHQSPVALFEAWSTNWLSDEFRDWSIENYLSQVRAPTLLIQGVNDEYGSMEQLNRIQASIKTAERLELEDCGHSPHFDQGSKVILKVASFLKNLS